MNQIEKVYSVYDVKAEAYTPFFSERTDGLAIRTIENAMSNPESNLARHCSDFELHCLGTFDVSSGKLISEIKHIINLDQLKKE